MQVTLKIRENKLIHSFPVTLEITEKRIWFKKMPFSKLLNKEIKSMRGYKWHGFDDPPVKRWSIENHPRNVFQLQALMGNNPYEWFDRPLVSLTKEDFQRPEYEEHGAEIKGQQIDMVSRGLMYHYQIWAAEQGLGKSLASLELMEKSGKKKWLYVGPKSALRSVEKEFKKWNIDPTIQLKTLTYEGFVSEVRYDKLEVPDGVVFDESSALKTPATQRSESAQYLADLIREKHGFDGYVILMSGTPSAKHPTDLWSQCEIAWPGFLREGSLFAFEQRYAVKEEIVDLDGVAFTRRTGWKEKEVAELPNRYAGLMTVYRKCDWSCLPEKKYRTVRLEPSKKVLRVAKGLCNIAPNTITALNWTRSLSSGFQYVTQKVGEEDCPVCEGNKSYKHPGSESGLCPGCAGQGKRALYDRVTKKVKTPKDDALRDLLDAEEWVGRIVIAAAYQGSIDRILDICKQRGWAVAAVDGRGWRCYDSMGNSIKGTEPLDLWDDHHGKVAFVGNPCSCKFGLTLTSANTLVFYDNDFSAENRLQMEDRIHRLSMNVEVGGNIVDLVHLPVDQLVLDTLKQNKKLELLSLGSVSESIGLDEDVHGEEELEEVA